jgi:hypothetical protein
MTSQITVLTVILSEVSNANEVALVERVSRAASMRVCELRRVIRILDSFTPGREAGTGSEPAKRSTID